MPSVIIGVRLQPSVFKAIAFEVEEKTGKLTMVETSKFDMIVSGIRDKETLTSSVVRFLTQYLLEKGIKRTNVLAFAIAMPGILDPDRGIIYRSGRFGLTDSNDPLDANQLWSEKLQRPVYVFHSGQCAALGEMKHGVGADRHLDTGTFVFISVGDGVGSTLYINGDHYRGESGVAGEFGRLVLVPDGEWSEEVGGFGCVEVYTSRKGINKRIMVEHQQGKVTGVHSSPTFSALLDEITSPDQITTQMLAAAAEDEEPPVVRALDEAAKKLGQGISMIVTLLNPGAIILGGELMDRIERYYRNTEFQITSFSFQEALHRDNPPHPGTEILRARLGSEAYWYGSAELALRRERSMSASAVVPNAS